MLNKNKMLKVNDSITHLSIISPVFMAEKIVDELVERISEEVSKITENFEIILVEDGSLDNSWEAIERNCQKDKRVKGIKLSRNFGQHYAITAGLEHSQGEVTILMDCDLQDDPVHIHLLYQKYKEGYDTVFTKRIDRKHSFFKFITAKIYNFLFLLFADANYDVNVGSLVLFTEKVRSEFLRIKDKDRLYIQLLKWVGFKQTYLSVEHREREEGTSTYSLLKLLSMALQGWTSHSDKLLRLSIYIGFTFSLFAFLGIGLIVILYFLQGFQSGWASLVILNLLSTGLILISIGIAGIYIGKNFEQAKDKPLYIVSKKINTNL
jgi:dolichol-phosphate mannosyltransferase